MNNKISRSIRILEEKVISARSLNLPAGKLIDIYTKEILSEIINLFNNHSDNLVSWVKEYTYLSARPHTVDDAALESLMSDINLAFGKNLSIHEFFYNLSIRNGMLNLAYQIRKNLTEHTIEEAPSLRIWDQKKIIKAAAAELEAGNLHNYENLSRRVLTKPFQYSILNKSFGIEDNNPIHKYIRGIQRSSEFYKFIHGKRIAIVGPANTETPNGDEIEKFDIVVRCNHKDKNVGYKQITHGSRADISYLNSGQVKHIINNNHRSWPVSTQWFVCKSVRHKNHIKKWLSAEIDFQNQNIRHAIKINDVLFNGTLNMIPIAIFDLLQHEPSEIKIFNTDFMLTESRTDGYYPENWGYNDRMKETFLRSSALEHDPITQFSLLDELKHLKIIKVDHRLGNVLNLGAEKFMGEMHKQYSAAGLMNIDN